MRKELTFDEVKHQYALVGEGFPSPLILPSVSQVLKKAGMYGYGRTEANIRAMNRGTHIHKVTTMLDAHIVAVSDLDEEDQGYASAYEKFVVDYTFEPKVTENPTYHPKYMYAGTPDRIGLITQNGVLTKCLIDIKTGQPHPATDIQLAAYREMVNSIPLPFELSWYPVAEAYALYLQASGEYKFVPAKDHYENWVTFTSALRIARWRDQHGIGRE